MGDPKRSAPSGDGREDWCAPQRFHHLHMDIAAFDSPALLVGTSTTIGRDHGRSRVGRREFPLTAALQGCLTCPYREQSSRVVPIGISIRTDEGSGEEAYGSTSPPAAWAGRRLRYPGASRGAA